MTQTPRGWDIMEPLCKRIHNGEAKTQIALETGYSATTICKYYRAWCHKNGFERRKAYVIKADPPKHDPPKPEPPPPELAERPANILIYDIETLPNVGYFWDTFSDRAIPLEFILKPKSICTIAYKWLGKPETYVLVISTPYEDKAILQAFLPEWSKADYVVAHYSRFDKPFIAARLMANGLPGLPPVNDICTYKLAKSHFGRSLNGNKLDHLGEILGLGRKNKTNANLWVGCAAGNKEALTEMAAYNKQDVDLLADVFMAMLPHIKSKLNLNLMTDEPTLLCKQCGSDRLEHRGYEYTAASMRHRYHCSSCGSWSTFPRRKT